MITSCKEKLVKITNIEMPFPPFSKNCKQNHNKSAKVKIKESITPQTTCFINNSLEVFKFLQKKL